MNERVSGKRAKLDLEVCGEGSIIGAYVSDLLDARRERDEARDLLRRAYNEAMDHDIDSRELDEKIRLILQERVLRGEGGGDE